MRDEEKFQGFTHEAVEFLRGIRENNNRAWFEEHKEQFKSKVQQPMKGLASEIFHNMMDKYPDFRGEMHVSRIYKDFRRVKNGIFYNDAIWYVLRDKDYDRTGLCLFLKFDGDKFRHGLCLYYPRAQVMENFRNYIDREPKEMEHLIKKINHSKRFVLEGTDYKRKKGGGAEILEPWYQKRSFELICRRDIEEPLFYDKELVSYLMDGYDELMPFYMKLSKIL